MAQVYRMETCWSPRDKLDTRLWVRGLSPRFEQDPKDRANLPPPMPGLRVVRCQPLPSANTLCSQQRRVALDFLRRNRLAQRLEHKPKPALFGQLGCWR